MKGMVAVFVVISMIAASLGIAGVVRAGEPRDLTPIVETGSTDRLGGGDWISVRAGDARVGGGYGAAVHPNPPYGVAGDKRLLGGADLHGSRGRYRRAPG